MHRALTASGRPLYAMNSQGNAASPPKLENFDVPTQLTYHLASAELKVDSSRWQSLSQWERQALTLLPSDDTLREKLIQFSVGINCQLADEAYQEDLSSTSIAEANSSRGRRHERSASRTFVASGLADVATAIISDKSEESLCIDHGADAQKLDICLRPAFVRKLAAIRARAETASMTQVEEVAREASLFLSCRRVDSIDVRSANSSRLPINATASDVAGCGVNVVPRVCALVNVDGSTSAASKSLNASTLGWQTQSTEKVCRFSQHEHQTPKASWTALPPTALKEDWILHLTSSSQSESNHINARSFDRAELSQDGSRADRHCGKGNRDVSRGVKLGSWRSVNPERRTSREWQHFCVVPTQKEQDEAVGQPGTPKTSSDQRAQPVRSTQDAVTSSLGSRETDMEVTSVQKQYVETSMNLFHPKGVSGSIFLRGDGKGSPGSPDNPVRERCGCGELSPRLGCTHIDSQSAPGISPTQVTQNSTLHSGAGHTGDIPAVQRRKSHLESKLGDDAKNSTGSEAAVVMTYSLLTSLESALSDTVLPRPSAICKTDTGKNATNQPNGELDTAGAAPRLSCAPFSQSPFSKESEATGTLVACSNVAAAEVQGETTGTASDSQQSASMGRPGIEVGEHGGANSPYTLLARPAASRQTPKRCKGLRLSKSPLSKRSAGVTTPARTARRSGGRARTKTIAQVYSPLVYAPLDPSAAPVTPQKRAHSLSPPAGTLRRRGRHARFAASSAECLESAQGDFASSRTVLTVSDLVDMSVIEG